MPTLSRDVSPGPRPRTVETARGEILSPPADWILLEPGDAALTRRVKQAGPAWTVTEKRGRKSFSRGVWAPADRVERIRADLARERAEPGYGRQLEAGRARRARQEDQYVGEFEGAVRAFLAFAPVHSGLADRLAKAITAHAVPVGSGTVARTRRISVEERTEAATIAWLRHHTTGYDSMKIARVRGERRAVRRQLAERSRQLLARYRQGASAEPGACPIHAALAAAGQAAAAQAGSPS